MLPLPDVSTRSKRSGLLLFMTGAAGPSRAKRGDTGVVTERFLLEPQAACGKSHKRGCREEEKRAASHGRDCTYRRGFICELAGFFRVDEDGTYKTGGKHAVGNSHTCTIVIALTAALSALAVYKEERMSDIPPSQLQQNRLQEPTPQQGVASVPSAHSPLIPPASSQQSARTRLKKAVATKRETKRMVGW
jgi:hypothetical protein